jgi:hypothetical protein
VAEAASILTGVGKEKETKEDAAKQSEDDIFDQYAGVLESAPKKESDNWRAECKNELHLYRAETTPGMRTVNGKEDPLFWWKFHHVAFPTLWRLARVYLAIPAIAAPPQRAFNLEASVVAENRYSLSHGLTDEFDFLFDNAWILEEDS